MAEFGIANAIYRSYEKQRVQQDSGRPERVVDAPFYASEAGKCGRAVTYARLGFAGEGFSGKTLRIFAAGDAFEAQVVSELRRSGFRVTGQQQSVRIEYPPVSGKIDGILCGSIGGEPVTRLLELKSINDRGFDEWVKNGIQVAQRSYYLQVQIYLFTLSMSEATVIAGNKNTQQLHEETVRYDPVWLVEEMLRLLYVHECLTVGRLADPEFVKSSWMCRYCTFSQHCSGLPEVSKPKRTARVRAK